MFEDGLHTKMVNCFRKQIDKRRIQIEKGDNVRSSIPKLTSIIKEGRKCSI